MAVEKRKVENIISDHPAKKIIGSLLLISIIGIPIAIIWGIARSGHVIAKKNWKANEILQSVIGGPPDDIDYEEEFSSAHCIALKETTVYILFSKDLYIIPWKDIRGWYWSVEHVQGASPLGMNPVENLRQGAENRRAEEQSDEQSGFFLKLRDTDMPELQLKTKNTKLCKKWHEVFTQINEGSYEPGHSGSNGQTTSSENTGDIQIRQQSDGRWRVEHSDGTPHPKFDRTFYNYAQARQEARKIR